VIAEYIKGIERGIAACEAKMLRQPHEAMQRQIDHWKQTLECLCNGGIDAQLNMTKRGLVSDRDAHRVEIIVLKYKLPNIERQCMSHLIQYTNWPYKVTWYDARNQPANFAKLWNRLIYESSCEYIVIMDSDAYVPPYWLEQMMACFQPDFICKKSVVVEKSRKQTILDKVIDENAADVDVYADPVGVVVPVTKGPGAHAIQYKEWKDKSPCLVQDQVSGFFFLFRRDVLDDVGYFDERFYLYGQDSEWIDRVVESKWNIVMHRGVCVEHDVSASIKQARKTGEFDYEADGQMTRLIYDIIREEKKQGIYTPFRYGTSVESVAEEALRIVL
jgi:hypothetical protein